MAEDKKQNGKRQRRPSAKKRDIQNLKRNLRNRSFKARVGTAVRAFNDKVSKKDATATKEELSAIYSLMDKGVKKGIYKINRANRVKSRLSAVARKV